MLKHKKLVSFIATIAICLSFLAPALIAPAAAVAATGITVVGGVQTVTSGDPGQALGTIKVTIEAGEVASDDTIFVTLPDDYTFGAAFDATPNAVSANDNEMVVPATISGDPNGLLAADYTIEGGALGSNEIQITANNDQALDYDAVFYLYFGDMDVDNTSDDCVAVVDGPDNTGFPTGSVTIAKVSSGGDVTLTAKDTVTSNNDFDFTLRVKESALESLELGADAVVLTLPDGYEWTTADASNQTATGLWGDDIQYDFVVDEEELSITFDGVVGALGTQTTDASAWEFDLAFEVVDDSAVEAGDIIAEVNGDSSLTPSELKVGKYGDFGVTITADATPDVFFGQVAQEIGDITIEEQIGESLIDGRYITLTLPSYAKWYKIDTPSADSGVSLNYVGLAGTEAKTIKFEITNTGDDSAAELTFENMEVALDVGAPGDLVVTVGGNAGISGEVVVAKTKMPVSISAAAPTEVKIGASFQPISDITITESAAGAIDDEGANVNSYSLILKTPAGVEWAKLPTITVESGDLKLDLSQVKKAKTTDGDKASDYYQYLYIPVDRDSNVASTIKISGGLVNVDRTVAEGNLYIALVGGAVLKSNSSAYSAISLPLNDTPQWDVPDDGMFPQTLAIGVAAAAKVVTPAPTQTGNSASFYIGSTVMVVNGSNVIMDAAPYIKDGRTFVPVRYLGDALGATTAWDAATKTVTVTKGEKTIVLVIGSKTAMVNGVAVAMDVAPEIVAGRTMLPARYVAEGLGYSVGYNAALQQVIIQ